MLPGIPAETEWWWHKNSCLENKIICDAVCLLSGDYSPEVRPFYGTVIWLTEKRVEGDAEQQWLRCRQSDGTQKSTYQQYDPALTLSKVKCLAVQKELCLSGWGEPNLWPAEWFFGCHLLVRAICCYGEARNVMTGTRLLLHVTRSELSPHTYLDLT